eukprot:gb/GFBE01072259.1/.p1 GENE.gb/GFBE01072259.1/~~gb/GFBE01072259.1/.p1  ORF type:complete len:321 (+),score=43.47 gb/GFBE01072259.1/:1-963(+)
MGFPLEKVHKFLGLRVRVKQVFSLSKTGPLDEDVLYFVQIPDTALADVPPTLAERLPFKIQTQTRDWYFIQTGGRTWEEHLASLKSSHAKKLRRYSRKPAKYGYAITREFPHKFSDQKLLRCFELLCETTAYNSDTNFYTFRSFVAYVSSVREGVLIASHSDGRILGFYSGDVIGHDHAPEFSSWGVYHNLFIEYAKSGFEKGVPEVDLGNTNDSFKQELGGLGRTVSFDLRAGRSWRGLLCLMAWAASSMLTDVSRTVTDIMPQSWQCNVRPALIIAVMVAVTAVVKHFLQVRWLEVLLLLGICQVIWSSLSGMGDKDD